MIIRMNYLVSHYKIKSQNQKLFANLALIITI